MARTSILTAQGAALSNIILGAGGPQAASYQVQWAGPFQPGEAFFLGQDMWADVIAGVPITVSLAQLQLLAESDPAWWAITG